MIGRHARVVVWSAAVLSVVCAHAGERPDELIGLVHSSAGPAPVLRLLTIYEDRTVSYGTPDNVEPCLPLGKQDYDRIVGAIEEHLDVLGAADAAHYRDSFGDHEELGFIFPRKPDAAWRDSDVSIPVVVFPVRLVPLVEELDRAGRTACGERYIAMGAEISTDS